jgi:tetratricopeptide (TPR) repeat protein
MVVPFEQLRDEFGAGVRGVGCTLFLLSWANPLSLSRAWCVFEVAVSLECGASFECILPPRDEAAFAAALEDDLSAAAFKLTNVVDARASTAAQAADKEHIDALITDTLGGHHKVDTMLVGAVRHWMLKCGMAHLARMPLEEAAVAPLKRELAFLHWLEGTSEGGTTAALLFEESYRDCLRVRGVGHSETAFSACRYGRNLVHRGKLAEGEELLREGLAGLRAVRGTSGTRAAAWYAEALGWHGYVLRRLGKTEEAEAIAQETITVRQEVFGAAHEETSGALVDLGANRIDAGRLDEARELVEKGVAGYRASLPSNHPYLLWALREYVRLLIAQGCLAEAAALLEDSLVRGHEIRFGDAHETTKRLKADLAVLKEKLATTALGVRAK